ncbi:MAG: hypothetical protein IAF94_17235, partial [Pirellulaceae bacterium]|nr:hypothetical protein [Pirellulaceae bacterium]
MRFLRFQIFTAAALCLAVLPSLALRVSGAADPPSWPQWRGPNRDEISPDRGLLKDWNEKTPQHVWTAEGMGSG